MLALLGGGCDMPAGAPVVQTPQVYYFAKASFTAPELSQIQRDIVAPITTYYDDAEHGHVVAILLKKQGSSLIIESIIDQSTSDDPVYAGELMSRQADGTYGVWMPPDAGPGYEG